MSDYRSNIVKPSETGELGNHPLLEGLSDELKDPSKFEKIEKKLALIMVADHKHRLMGAYMKCKRCQKRQQKRKEAILELGFKDYTQYLMWKKVMGIIKEQNLYEQNED